MSDLIFIRHGQASFGASNYDVLSELGERQASAIGSHLKRSGYSPAKVFSGLMQRQRHTAELALAQLEGQHQITSLAAFNEYDSKGVFENYLPLVLGQFPEIRDKMTRDDFGVLKQRDVFQKLFFPVMKKWLDGEPADRAPMESWQTFRQRVTSGIDQLRDCAKEGHSTVVFTSGGVISVAMIYALGLEAEHIPEFNWRTANGSITRLIETKRGLKLENYNMYGHLQDSAKQLKVTYI